jgi:hypothetical protein
MNEKGVFMSRENNLAPGEVVSGIESTELVEIPSIVI